MTDEETKITRKKVALKYNVPDRIPTAYATQMVVQETETELNLYFFDATVPLMFGTQEEIERQAESINELSLNCVIRVVVPIAKKEAFKRVFDKHLTGFKTESQD